MEVNERGNKLAGALGYEAKQAVDRARAQVAAELPRGAEHRVFQAMLLISFALTLLFDERLSDYKVLARVWFSSYRESTPIRFLPVRIARIHP